MILRRARRQLSRHLKKYLRKLGLVDTPQQARDRRLKEQQAAIAYWDGRVQARRVQWDKHTREAFDRNLQVINESLNQYTMILPRTRTTSFRSRCSIR